MNTGVISVRYARALFKSVEGSEANMDAVYADMQTLANSFIEVGKLIMAIDNPMLSKQEKEKLLIVACGGNPSPQTMAFIKLVLKEGRENIILFMANSFVTLYRQKKNIVSGKLITAVDVTADTEQRMEDIISKRTDAKVELKTEVNPDIIGGFILEYDTFRMDASVRTQLRSILRGMK